MLEEVANTVMTKSTAQNITSDVSLDDVTITDTLTTRNFYYRVRVNNDPLKINNAEVEKLLNRLNEKEAKLSELEALYNDAVRLNQDATITGKKVKYFFWFSEKFANRILQFNTQPVLWCHVQFYHRVKQLIVGLKIQIELNEAIIFFLLNFHRVRRNFKIFTGTILLV